MRRIVKIAVVRTWESCERTTYYVELTTDEGFTMTPASFATGSLHNEFKGLTVQEARDRAIITAHQWGDFLELPAEPYKENDVIYEPTWDWKPYTTRRTLRERRKNERPSSTATA